MTDWKPRFNYFWDWTNRLVQIGIWDDIYIEATGNGRIEDLTVHTDFDLSTKKGSIKLSARIIAPDNWRLRVELKENTKAIARQRY